MNEIITITTADYNEKASVGIRRQENNFWTQPDVTQRKRHRRVCVTASPGASGGHLISTT